MTSSNGLLKSVYRHLLRTIAYGVRHEKPKVKNLRRLLREDVRTAANLTSPDMFAEQVEQRASNTLLFHLAAQRSARSAQEAITAKRMKQSVPASPKTPLHRVMLNIASLGYHHLSPHTVVQPNLRSRRQGASDSRSLRQHRQRKVTARAHMAARRKGPRSIASDAAAATEAGGGYDVDRNAYALATADSVTVLPSLFVAGSRPRGPVQGPLRIRSLSAAPRWNGQSPERVMDMTGARKAGQEKRVDALAKLMIDAREKANSDGATKQDKMHFEKIYAEFRIERGELKNLNRTAEEMSTKSILRQTGADMLADIVRRAETNVGGAWLGSTRFGKWSKNEWLEPN